MNIITSIKNNNISFTSDENLFEFNSNNIDEFNEISTSCKEEKTSDTIKFIDIENDKSSDDNDLCISQGFNYQHSIFSKSINYNNPSKSRKKLFLILAQIKNSNISETEYNFFVKQFLEWFYYSNQNKELLFNIIDESDTYHNVISDLIVNIGRDKNIRFSILEKKKFLFKLLKSTFSIIRFGAIYGISYVVSLEDREILEKIKLNEKNPVIKSFIENQIAKLT
jgi:hypothetical protein